MVNEYKELLTAVSRMRSLQKQKETPTIKRELLNTEFLVDRLLKDGKEKLSIYYPSESKN